MRRSTVDRLRALEGAAWFANVGSPAALPDVVLVKSWEDALRRCESKSWRSRCAVEGSGLFGSIAAAAPGDTTEIERVIDEILEHARMLVEGKVQPRLPACGKRDDISRLVQSQVWNILLAIEFAEHCESDFYRALYHCYLHGHFPCGWRESHRGGKLVVY